MTKKKDQSEYMDLLTAKDVEIILFQTAIDAGIIEDIADNLPRPRDGTCKVNIELKIDGHDIAPRDFIHTVIKTCLQTLEHSCTNLTDTESRIKLLKEEIMTYGMKEVIGWNKDNLEYEIGEFILNRLINKEDD